MARAKNKVPSYLLHSSSGRARVHSNGHDIYLGTYDSPESKQAYARFIAENFSNGKEPVILTQDEGRLSPLCDNTMDIKAMKSCMNAIH